jgi:MFS-type transporter involved in bile tolerance (Atg22 family)
VVFLVMGSFADIGTWRPNILIVLSIIAYAVGFAWLGVHTEDKWQIAAGLYIIGLVAYQTTLTFWSAAFPSLARNTRDIREKADDYMRGTLSRDDYDFADTMKRSQLANTAFYIQSLAEIIILAVIVGIMFAVGINASAAKNNWGLSILIAFASGVWLLVSLPWFFLEKRRPGADPGNRSIIMVGLSQLYFAMRQVWRLKQSLLYLAGTATPTYPRDIVPLLMNEMSQGYFLLGDSLNTTVTLISTLQNSLVAYNTLQLTYLLLVGITTQVRYR